MFTATVSYLAFWIGARVFYLYFGLSSVPFPPPLPFESFFTSQAQRPQAPAPLMHPAHPMVIRQAAMPPMQQVAQAVIPLPGPPLQPHPQQMQPAEPMQQMPQVMQPVPMQQGVSNFKGLYKLSRQKTAKIPKPNGQLIYCLKGQGGYPYGLNKAGEACARPGPKPGKKNGQGKKKPQKKKKYKVGRSSE